MMADDPKTPAFKSNGMADKFKCLPIEDLIASPLKAGYYARTAVEFIDRIGFGTGADDKAGNACGLKFDFERLLSEAGTTKTVMPVPVLYRVPIPSFLVDEANIDFRMEAADRLTTTTRSPESDYE